MMTREEWNRYEQLRAVPDIRFAMRARCEEQGHEFDGCMSAMFQRWEECKWCGERKNFRSGIV